VSDTRAALPDGRTPVEAVVARESAATEERQWVRLTRRCNNHCLFCHDTDRHDGTAVPLEQVSAEIRAGRERGATRLVLSGGEPTIHPAFLDAVALGRRAGYRWVQAISNGRMFAYDLFTRRAVAAGLDEATISMHGHTAELHDALAGAPGAFAQGLRGLRNLQAAGRVVSVDVVVCRPNVRHLADILRFFLGLGVREFDLLHLVPFGRAFEERRADLVYDPRAERAHVLEALELAKLPGVHVWTNRWPAPLLEGAEHLIQDPHKILDELRGTFEGFSAYLETGDGPECRGERCGRCFLDGFCRALFDARERLLAGTFPVVAVAAPEAAALGAGARAAVERQSGAALRLRATGPAEAEGSLRILPRGGSADLHLDLATLDGLPPSLARRTRRAVVRREEALDPALALPHVQVEVPLERATAGLARRALALAPERVVLRMSGRSLLSETLTADLDPAEVAAIASGARAEWIAACLAPGAAEPAATLEAATLRPGGGLDLLAWAEHYVRDLYRTRSLRCEGCSAAGRCGGAHVNYVRAHGFGWMRPDGAA